MNKKDYLEVKEHLNFYKRFYLVTIVSIMILILLPIVIYVIELATGKLLVPETFLLVLYIICFIALIGMRPYLRMNRMTKKYIYFKSFNHIVDNHLSAQEVNTIKKQFKNMYLNKAIQLEDHLEVNLNRITINVYHQDVTHDLIKSCIKKVNHPVINVFIKDRLSKEIENTILFEVPEKTNKLLLNVGFEKETGHVYFCANNLYIFSVREKNMIQKILSSLFTNQDG